MQWKKILIIVALVIVALIVAAYVILSIYDFNKFKPTIARTVKEATGRELRLDGDIKLKVGFTLRLSVNDVGFQNAPWGTRPEMATLKRLEVKLAFLPLIRGEIDFKRLILVEPDVLVETDSSGKSNLEFAPSAKAPPSLPGEATPVKDETALPLLSLNEVRIENGLFTYREGRSGKTYAVKLNRLTAAVPSMESPIELGLTGMFNDRPLEIGGTLGPVAALTNPDEPWSVDMTARAVNATATVKGTIRDIKNVEGLAFNVTAEGQSIPDIAELAGVKGVPDLGPLTVSVRMVDSANALMIEALDLQVGREDLAEARVTGAIQDILTQRGLDLRFSVRGKDLANLEQLTGEPLPVQGPFSVSGKVIDPEAKVYRFSDLSVVLGQNDLRGLVDLNLAEKPLQVAAELSSETLDLRSVLTPEAAGQAGLGKLPDLGPLTVSVRMVDSANALMIEALDLQVGREDLAVVQVTGAIQDALSQRGVDLNFSVRGKNIENLEKVTNEQLPIGGPFSVSGRLIDPEVKVYEVTALKVVLADYEFSGSVKLNLALERLHIAAEISSGEVDLRPLLALAEDGTPGQPKTQKDRVFPDEPFSVDALRAADATVKIRFDGVLVPKLAVMDLAIDAALEDGHLVVEPFRCVIGSGNAEGQFDLRSQGKEVAMALALEIDKLNLGLMLDDLGVERFITGTVDARINVEGQGNSVARLMAGLNGTIVSVVSQGRLNNRYVDVFGAGIIRQMLQVINPLTKTENHSELNCLVNHFDIKDGLAESKGLVLDTNYTTVAGGGEINLKTEQLNLVFGLSPKQGVGISGVGKATLSIGKLAKNFKLGGTLAKPSLAINPKGTTVMIGKALGGMALLGPAGLAVALIDVSPGDPNPCLTAIETAQKGVRVSTTEEPEEEKGPQEETTKGVEGILKRLFGK